MAALLAVDGLRTVLATPRGMVTAVDGVSVRVDAGRTLAMVGESGSGKSMACSSILGLLPANGKVVGGTALFKGRDLLTMRPRELQAVRGREIGMILQDAMTSLNPLMTIGDQIGEVFRYHQNVTNKRQLRELAVQALEGVEIPAARERLDSYPFQFSGGMRQRVSIAINLACAPDLLICDEPTTALDVTVQLQILALLRDLQKRRKMAILFITHDLRMAAQFCDDVAVMYASRVVETGPIGDVFSNPAHPYTEALLRAVPSTRAPRDEPLFAIPGHPPALGEARAGCRFAPRCPEVLAACRVDDPDWFDWQDGRRRGACWQIPARMGSRTGR